MALEGPHVYGDGLYIGDVENGKRHGFGKQTYHNGSRYDGEWQNDAKHGNGKMVYPDGAEYEGSWETDLRHGRGRLTRLNGAYYEGDWITDRAQGCGVFSFGPADGRMYRGHWLADAKHGEGTMNYANGARYDGLWAGDQAAGRGRYTFADGRVYEGEWANNMKEGQGTMTFPNGDSYSGAWANNAACGVGIFRTRADGSVYEGPWDENAKNGAGRCTDADGTMWTELWDRGRLVSREQFIVVPTGGPRAAEASAEPPAEAASPPLRRLVLSVRAGDEEWARKCEVNVSDVAHLQRTLHAIYPQSVTTDSFVILFWDATFQDFLHLDALEQLADTAVIRVIPPVPQRMHALVHAVGEDDESQLIETVALPGKRPPVSAPSESVGLRRSVVLTPIKRASDIPPPLAVTARLEDTNSSSSQASASEDALRLESGRAVALNRSSPVSSYPPPLGGLRDAKPRPVSDDFSHAIALIDAADDFGLGSDLLPSPLLGTPGPLNRNFSDASDSSSLLRSHASSLGHASPIAATAAPPPRGPRAAVTVTEELSPRGERGFPGEANGGHGAHGAHGGAHGVAHGVVHGGPSGAREREDKGKRESAPRTPGDVEYGEALRARQLEERRRTAPADEGSEREVRSLELVINQLEADYSAARNLLARNGKIEQHFLDPISLEIMEDPVVASDGYTYERRTIEEWLRHRSSSPMTNLPLESTGLISNRQLKAQIASWREEMAKLQI